MNLIRTLLRRLFDRADRALDAIFTPVHNPMKQLGTLGLLVFAIDIVTGVDLFIGFDTSVTGAWQSVEFLTRSPWFLAGVVRSLHRYSSDLLVVLVFLHIAREFARDRYRGARWYSWFTGLPALLFVYGSGIGGYWLVWDELAQFIATVSAEWLDRLPIFGEPIARNFAFPAALDDRFFTLLIFLHIALPLMLALVLWLHLQRIARPAIVAPKSSAWATLGLLLALSLAFPAVSHPPADLARIPGTLGLDWFYLLALPAMDQLPASWTWGGGVVLLIAFAAMPFLPPLRRRPVAVVTLDHCNGCRRCAEDCPYNAITMVPRSDGKPFDIEAQVDPSLCVGCGICVGACPPSTPFRHVSPLRTGIDLTNPSLDDLRAALVGIRLPQGQVRVLTYACAHSAGAAEDGATISLPCLAMLPPSFIDYTLSRGIADAVLLVGCGGNACHNRLGEDWMQARLAGTRDPHLRARVDRARIEIVWASPAEADACAAARAALAGRVASIPPEERAA